MDASNDAASVGQLLSALARDTGALMKQEVQLAVNEMSAKAESAARNAAFLAAGGALVHAGLIVLLFAAVVGLGRILPLWLSATIIGGIIVVLGAFLVLKARATLGSLDPVPEQTVASIKADVAMGKDQFQ